MSFCQKKKKIFCLIFFAIDFLRYQINDKLAFPLLLRGLEHTENWTKLNRVELKEDIATPDILNPEVKNFFFSKKTKKKKGTGAHLNLDARSMSHLDTYSRKNVILYMHIECPQR